MSAFLLTCLMWMWIAYHVPVNLSLHKWMQFYNLCNFSSFEIYSFLLSFRLEKEYTTIKTKEMEEQVEIKVWP